ncbi:GntR family transcriptional regulator [Falsigemmobacter intermedius]|uniref:GntR family transcriptional regulator n=1 Tax=Falsigemmobacter intermedius TaxID=1553448 RepID=UPI003F06B551
MNRRAQPLYLEVRRILTEELAQGLYPVGSRFPTEQELVERFGYARQTVREALRGLQDSGLIARQTKTGTVVLATRAAEPFSNKINSLDELWQYAKVTRFEQMHEGVVILRDTLAEVLGRKAGERWLRMAGYRRHIGELGALCWSEIYVAEPYIGIRTQVDHDRTAIYSLLSEQFDLQIERVDRQLRAVAMPADVAPMLRAAPGSPALMERRTFFALDRGEFEITLSIYPGDRFSHKTSLVRETRAPSVP